MMANYNEFYIWYKNAICDLTILPEEQLVYNKTERIFITVCGILGCFPCCLYSSLIRLLLIPCTCGKSLGGNFITKDSDNCITDCINEINKTKDFTKTKNLEWVISDKNPIIIEKLNKVLDIFVAKYQTYDTYEKYKMCDWLSLQLSSLGYKISILPDTVIDDIANIRIVPSAPPIPDQNTL